jgi:adenylosuccinate lyase
LVFRDLIAQDPQIKSRISPEILMKSFELDRQLANVDTIFDRVLGAKKEVA